MSIENECGNRSVKTFGGMTPEKIQKAASNYIKKVQISNSLTTTTNNLALKNDIKEKSNQKALKDIELNHYIDTDSGLIEYLYDNLGNKTFVEYDDSQNIVKLSANVSYLSKEIANEYSYENDVLRSITRNNQTYDFLYDKWGNNSGVEIQGKPYISYKYKDGIAQLCEKVDYGNGQSVNYYYDNLNRISSISTNNGQSSQYEYEYSGDNITVIDNVSGIIQKYFEDTLEIIDIKTNKSIMKMFLKNENTLSVTLENTSFELSVSEETPINGGDYATTLQYILDGLTANIKIFKDHFDRTVGTMATYSSNETMNTKQTYLEYNDYATHLPKTYTTNYLTNQNNVKNTWTYEYYNNGQIKNIILNGSLYTNYEYDEIGQLVKCNDYVLGKTTTYQFDNGGNIRSKSVNQMNSDNPQTNDISFSYSNQLLPDQLTNFNGNEIKYDAIGNPISFDNQNLKWINGRFLQEYNNEKYLITYTYDDIGLRQSKQVYDKKTKTLLYEYRYYWNESFVTAYTITDYTNIEPKTDTIVYQYDDNMNIYSFVVNGKDVYIYEKNAFGDVIGIYNKEKQVAKYHYDEYGNVFTIKTNGTVEKYNQIYYRGYMYDSESNLYYLQSRYYSPVIGRFLNADLYVDTETGVLGTNMYLYCNNDPINKIDPNGFWGVSIHKQITKEVLSNATLEYNLDANKIAEGNADTDTKYSAVVYFFMPTRQGRHFDRHIRVEEANGEDTRGYFAGEHMQNAINAYHQNDFNKMNEEFGYALHCFQDFSSHGNIDVDTWALASHVGIDGADSPNYEWKDDNDRGKTNKEDCLKKVNVQYGKRYEEAQQSTVIVYILFLVALDQS